MTISLLPVTPFIVAVSLNFETPSRILNVNSPSLLVSVVPIFLVEPSDVTSMFAMEEIKSTTRLPLNYLP